MKNDVFDLSEKNIREDYEDLIFRKVMAIRCEEESREILEEIKKTEEANERDSKTVERIFGQLERKENIKTLSEIAKKAFLFAASFVFVVIISASSAVVASADVRDAVTEAIYHLVFEENEKYTLVSVGESTGFVDPELYDWEGAYAPTYMPEGYEFVEREDHLGSHTLFYSNGTNKIVFRQIASSDFLIDTEDSDEVKYIKINESDAILIYKNNKTTISWHIGNTLLSVECYGNSDEILKIAQSIKIVK